MVMEEWSKSGDTSPSSPRYYIICVTLDGIPMFSLTEGQLPSLSFPVMGSLNAVHMFVKENHVDMGCTTAEGAKILWKEYGSIKLIFVNFELTPDSYLSSQLDCIYKCMVMVLGAHEFSKITNIEKLKRKMKLCFPLILEFLNTSHLFCNVTHLTDVVITEDSALLQSYLNTYAEECQSEFGCVTLHGKVAVGTEKFWHLSPIETCLVLHLIASLSPSSAMDIPIYLPNGSPTVPHRLVSICLLEHIYVILICGPSPSLQQIIHKYVKKYWEPLTHTLRSYSRLHPRGFPPEIKLDSNLLGFILINLPDRKTFASIYPHGTMTGSDHVYLSDAQKRKKVLMTFYKSIVSSLFRKNKEVVENAIPHEVKETYRCMDKFKLYALRSKNHQLFTLFNNDLPTYALGNVSKIILKQLTKDKLL